MKDAYTLRVGDNGEIKIEERKNSLLISLLNSVVNTH
jgi:hypothetical protein